MFKSQAGAPSTKARGDAAEARALAWLQARGLTLVERNYRVALGPRARGGEIDLIMRSPDDVIGEDGVQSIGNATPVAKALLDAEVGEEVFLDGDAPQARPLKVLRVW